MDDDAVISFEGLKEEFGIVLSRTHVKRREDEGTFPKRIKPFGDPKSRSYWLRREIRAWLSGLWGPTTPAPKKK